MGETPDVNDTVRFRVATDRDVPRLQDIESAAGEAFRSIDMSWVADDPPPPSELLLGHIGSGTAWVATDDETVVGYAIASMVDGEGHVDQVSVDPIAAGRRIGERLLGLVDDWAAAHGATSTTLTTFRDVPWNAPYYRRLGFVDVAEAEIGPELRSIRAAERAAGLDAAPRLAMRRVIVTRDR